ncbi:hypothetical protein AJ80_03853 [Polytolypa hystricis UAMH7299]|uniref:Clock-controlled protein 8 n=1 Tax=Polytolypa hystricis (strain UAMH7299) TaxID=1447883 RepID=A0A2B7YFK8_POLH7|nr:hypothetical protein AJ80_03853 [Polytolypa hystricis UAMH7299]
MAVNFQYAPGEGDATISNQMDVDSVGSNEDRSRRATSVISMDDIEAAQALEGLRSDYIHSAPSSRTMNQSPPSGPSGSEAPQPEPLISLLTSSHPILSSAINSSMSVYTTSKSYSPRFKYGAEFLERKIGSPVVNTVGTVGRKTGVEGGLRWALQRRQTNDANANTSDSSSATQTNVDTSDAMDIEKATASPRPSATRRSSGVSSFAETLPPYDTLSSPNYEEVDNIDSKTALRQQAHQTSWQGRLMVTTSGLGVAMSEESLRSLTYCLAWLRWANTRLGNAIITLKKVLQEWDDAKKSLSADTEAGLVESRDPSAVSQQIQQLKGDVLQTLKQVVDIVSKYAGGALPENARNLVRRHLTSLPQRFRMASTSNMPKDGSKDEPDVATRARRVLLLTEEGLDMMAQVSGVVNDTLVSAEGWCEKLRRPMPTPAAGDPNMPPQNTPAQPMDTKVPIPAPQSPKDVDMAG